MKVIHFEIQIVEPDRAVAFYTKVFGWKIDKWGDQDYWMVTAGDDKEEGINGAFSKGTPGHGTNIVINTPDIDKTISDIKENGGTVNGEKNPIPHVGIYASFTDPEGNSLGILQPEM